MFQFFTRAQQLLRWATVPEQSGPKSGGGAAVLLSLGKLGLHPPQCRLGRGLRPVELAALHAATKNMINPTARTGGPYAEGEMSRCPHIQQI